MQLKYRSYRRRNGVFYWQENDSPKQGTLRTADRREAERLLNAMNESHREPTLNLNLARAYLAAHDPKMAQRTWQAVMDEMATHGIPTTQERCARAFRSKAYDPIRNKPLVQTTGANLLAIIHANGNCVAHYLRRLHNLAVDLGWLPWPALAKRAWPKIRSQNKRAITAEEHGAVIASEKNLERRACYELLYETGAAQTDAANLTAENIDWQNGVLVYHRKKLEPLSEPCRLTIGNKLRTLLQSLPASGDLFPNIRKTSANHRAAEFRRRCLVAGITGVSLHSYRHAWAQRAKACGYPQRFAQVALGHSSRAVHEAYAKGALVILPALDEYEQVQAAKVIPLRSTSADYALTN
ncbi:MAG TPA: tyrosine-type recombinase/integrase [Candidatus Udaeobacter sp.]|nr:tyrosine-type recombinase/integrase [Candidatus Udaeobacter sp.]